MIVTKIGKRFKHRSRVLDVAALASCLQRGRNFWLGETDRQPLSSDVSTADKTFFFMASLVPAYR